MKLYTATIRGFKYYFSGDLTFEAIQASEQFCHKLEADSKSTDTATLFTLLLSYIESNLGVSVTQVNIDHIFRINY